ncbi:MAG: hypothetical protein SWY16_06615 [Cyanobacteriota bacterium]|nr:hypothetical protein [Cyanobacteriota bacterium]
MGVGFAPLGGEDEQADTRTAHSDVWIDSSAALDRGTRRFHLTTVRLRIAGLTVVRSSGDRYTFRFQVSSKIYRDNRVTIILKIV